MLEEQVDDRANFVRREVGEQGTEVGRVDLLEHPFNPDVDSAGE